MRRATLALLLVVLAATGRAMPTPDYAIVVSSRTWDTPGWQAVVAALQSRHNSTVLLSDDPLSNAPRKLRQLHPRYVAFVIGPDELDGAWARRASRLIRDLDDDPWPDALWGIVTGPAAPDALRIARTARPLTVRTALTLTGVNARLFTNLLTLSDAHPPGRWQVKTGDQLVDGDDSANTNGTTARFAAFFTNTPPDALVTSGHATQRNLEMPFGFGSLVATGGRLHLLDRPAFDAWRHDRTSDVSRLPSLPPQPGPRVLLAAGNCLIGDTERSPTSLANTWLGAGGVNQLVGYTVPTWFGRSGWGTLDLWQTHAGQLSLAESFFLNHARLIHELRALDPDLVATGLDATAVLEHLEHPDRHPLPSAVQQRLLALPEPARRNALGLIHDQDAVAFLGDPAWDARLDPGPAQHPLEWTWTRDGQRQHLDITARRAHALDAPLPFLLPARSPGARLLCPDGTTAELTDDVLFVTRAGWTNGQSLRFTVSPP